MSLPYLAVANARGEIFETRDYLMTGMSLDRPLLPDSGDIIPLPHGSNLYVLPGRTPIGWDPRRREFVPVRAVRGEPVSAVAAFMAPAYMQLARAAAERPTDDTKLPLYAYTALGWRAGRFYAAGTRIDGDVRQDPNLVDLDAVEAAAARTLARYPGNRLVGHLVENCVRCYGCPAARNFVLGRWEVPVPASRTCNAGCVGCISLQPTAAGVPSSQDRLTFTPSPEEVAEFVVPHLESAPRPVASFGQGCEGEPLLAVHVLETSIRAIRARTDRGVINMNTNASRPEAIERLARAGLQSIRVSLNSAQPAFYAAYYRPRGYDLEAVIESMRVARRLGLWVSLNYLVFPGVTDREDEMRALEAVARDAKINMIQTRNLNIDPDWYVDTLGLRGDTTATAGMRAWLKRVRERLPWVRLGYFNPPREDMKPEHYVQ
jgi:molybdenum cofactor biosynthesis enzyme MoaA